MRIQLKPGEKLTIGFYVAKEDHEGGGWRAPEDFSLDGEFEIEFTEARIRVTADMPDDKGRGGHPELNESARCDHWWHTSDSMLVVCPNECHITKIRGPVIYEATVVNYDNEEDVDARE